MNWMDVLTRAGKTAYQAFVAALIPLGDVVTAAVIAALSAAASAAMNVLSGAERPKLGELIELPATQLQFSDEPPVPASEPAPAETEPNAQP